MKQLKTVGALLLAGAMFAPAALAQGGSPENYMRSSIYTFLIKSDAQNKALEEEAAKESSGTAMLKGFGVGKNKEKGSVSVVEAPQIEFLKFAIPDQFNNHNLGNRVVMFDQIAAGLSEADLEAAKELAGGKKKGGFGAKLGGIAKAAAGVPDIPSPNKEVNEKALAVALKYLNDNHVADSLVAKWFEYGQDPAAAWNCNLVIERGMYDASPEEIAKAKAQGLESGLGQSRGLELIKNTYVLGINLRFRSNQAIVAEAEAIAAAVGGGAFGGGLSMLSAGAAAAAGEGFCVTAKTYLFKLVWDKDIENKFATGIVEKNAKFEDLVKMGLCKLEYVGSDEGKARVRQSLNNKTSQDVLVARATERAIDDAIAKLQGKYEAFRTAFPISEVDEAGNIIAKVGMKEGIGEGDEYEILEMTEDPKTGEVKWKSVGKAKPIKDQIWDNRAGAAEEVAEGASDDGNLEAAKVAASLGGTKFSGGKKGKDLSGYFLRLKKKK